MYSSQKGSKYKTPERDTVAPSLNALSPFVDAIKSAQTKATKDFESFYGNLLSRLTPKTSNSRIYKKTPETSQRTRSLINQKRFESEHSRTSLTPLFERHTLKEVYSSQNPFYEDSGSETTDGLLEFDMVEDVAPSPVRAGSKRRIDYSATNLLDKLKDESKRMDKLQSNIAAIKRQSSFLAQETTSTENSKEHNIPLLRKEDSANNNTMRTPQPTITDTYLTPPQSNKYYRLSPQSITRTSPQSATYSSDISAEDKTNDKKDMLHEIPYAKLKSAEIIKTPGGTRICNRFWKEIHGLNAKRELSLSPVNTGRVEKPRRSSTLNKRLWDDKDDSFWMSESSTSNNSSSFNQRLVRMKQFEEQKNKQASLSEEIELANKKEHKKSLPTANPLLLEELKAKYRDRLLDDSDSYKFS